MTDPLTDFVQTYAPQLASEITEDTPLIEQGLLNSLLLMNLVAFLDRRIGLAVPDEEIVPENFGTLRSIRSLITRLTSEV
jgi:2-hydroxymuconate-semialdehyde hydrolase